MGAVRRPVRSPGHQTNVNGRRPSGTDVLPGALSPAHSLCTCAPPAVPALTQDCLVGRLHARPHYCSPFTLHCTLLPSLPPSPCLASPRRRTLTLTHSIIASHSSSSIPSSPVHTATSTHTHYTHSIQASRSSPIIPARPSHSRSDHLSSASRNFGCHLCKPC